MTWLANYLAVVSFKYDCLSTFSSSMLLLRTPPPQPHQPPPSSGLHGEIYLIADRGRPPFNYKSPFIKTYLLLTINMILSSSD